MPAKKSTRPSTKAATQKIIGYPQEFGPNYNGLVVDGEKIGF